jgi:hypothetical protein
MKRVWHLVRGVVTSSIGVVPSPIFVTVVKSSIPVPENAFCAGPDGGFEIRLPEGTFTIRAYADDGQLSGESDVTVPPPQTAPVTIYLQEKK